MNAAELKARDQLLSGMAPEEREAWQKMFDQGVIDQAPETAPMPVAPLNTTPTEMAPAVVAIPVEMKDALRRYVAELFRDALADFEATSAHHGTMFDQNAKAAREQILALIPEKGLGEVLGKIETAKNDALNAIELAKRG